MIVNAQNFFGILLLQRKNLFHAHAGTAEVCGLLLSIVSTIGLKASIVKPPYCFPKLEVYIGVVGSGNGTSGKCSLPHLCFFDASVETATPEI